MAKSKVVVEDKVPLSCANCATNAFYVYQVTDSFSIPYCQYHLPRFLINSDLVAQVSNDDVEEVVEDTDAPNT